METIHEQEKLIEIFYPLLLPKQEKLPFNNRILELYFGEQRGKALDG